MPVVVIDNGASTIKVGLSTNPKAASAGRDFPNAVIRSKGDKKTYFGHEFDACHDHSSLHFRLPFEKGYIVDWDAQKAIWDGMFSGSLLGIDTTESSILITEPYLNLPKIQDIYDQFVFEEYEFQSYYRCTPASLIPHGKLYSKPGLPAPECMLVVDSGFSFTHIVPIMNGVVQWNAVKRVDVGGKLLTNQLKELVSFRQWNMMDETHIMNDVKETCCYVSTSFAADLEACRANPRSNPIIQEYILPDFSTNKRGRVRQPGDPPLSEGDQILNMGNERFSVPEILFRPDDIGLPQCGITGAIAQSIALLPDDLQGLFWANIGLIGGNVKFPGFAARLMSELRSLAPVDCEVVIYESIDAIHEAHHSALALSKLSSFPALTVSRAEYLESGSNACRRKFEGLGADDDVQETGGAGGRKGKGRAKHVDSDEDEIMSDEPTPKPKVVRTRTRTVSGVKRR
ncbi:Actin/actin-like protein [Dentipellis sp. KUC8613]|nr:Actin/actin-like protein [Dentipellis sp. KUC8613]